MEIDKENLENSNFNSSLSHDSKVFLNSSSSSLQSPSLKKLKINSNHQDIQEKALTSNPANIKLYGRNAALLMQLKQNESNLEHEKYLKTNANPVKISQFIEHFQLKNALPSKQYTDLLELWQDLQELGLLTGKIMKWFALFEQITTLDMSKTYGRQIVLEPYKVVFASKQNPTNCTLPLWNGFIMLEVLNLSNIDIGDEDLRYLTNLTNLKSLNLENTKISPLGLAYLAHYARFKLMLKYLSLKGNASINDGCSENLGKFANILELDIAETGMEITGIRKLGKEFLSKSLARIFISSQLRLFLDKMHTKFAFYSLPFSVDEIFTQPRAKIQKELTKFGSSYGDINLCNNTLALQKKLVEIIQSRCAEEFIWSITL